MDRWGGGDGQERGPTQPLRGVSKLGMGSFVKSSTGMGSGVGEHEKLKIEVVVSRREQKRQQMPPPPPMHKALAPTAAPAAALAAQAAAGPPGSFQAPAWAGQPTAGATLEVSKGGQVIERIPLNRPATLFGRSPTADVVLDHPSLSRQHAAVCFERTSLRWMLLDLNSAHGTFVNGCPVGKGVPVELHPGSLLRFAASSRDYALRITQRPAEQARPPGPQRSKLWAQPADEDHQPQPVGGYPQEGSSNSKAKRKREVLEAKQPEDTSERNGSRSGAARLEQATSYTDRCSPSGRAGPAPDSASEGGRFQNLVQVRVLKDRGGQPDALQRRAPEPEKGRLQHAQQPFLERSIYTWLPPPGSSAQAS